MRLLHTSDWHLGRVLHEHSLLEDQKHFLDGLLDHLRVNRYDALLLAGDVFDRAIPPEEAVALWNGFLEAFCTECPDTALLAITGNHDSATRVAVAARVIERTGIHLRGGAERLAEPVTIRDAEGAVARIWMVPFLWSGSLQEGADGQRVLQTQEEALAEAVRRIRAQADPAELNVLVAHCFASGGQVSDSERTLVGTAVQVDPGLFEGFDYVALGHLHRPQALGPRIRYSGTPLPYSFSEASQRKSMAAVTLAKGVEPAVDLVPVQPFRAMMDLKGTLAELQADPKYAGLE
ncbi:MAG TPA: exonuclease subunit SbcD, partial [Holophaga sp.]|nr:exonuclease subunit SbcD [Holophaga sp.]